MSTIDLTLPTGLSSVALAAGAGSLLWLSVKLARFLKSSVSQIPHLPLPPGPKGLPLIGNLLDLPVKEQWVKACEWAEQYGEIFYINAVGQSFIYLNTYEAACELLELRSSKYSDRVLTEMVKMIGADDILVLTPYGDKWRKSRRIFHQEFNSNTAVNFMDSQLQHVHAMLLHMFQNPKSFEHHVKHYSSGVILEKVYGIQVKENNDPYVRNVELVMSLLDALVNGFYLVDFFPFLKHVPAWLPGATFKREALRYNRYLENNRVLAFQASQTQSDLSENKESNMIATWKDKLYEKNDGQERQQLESYLPSIAATALIGGYETTTSTLLIFIHLMMLHPEVQRKARNELDAVVGRSRLPDFSDKENLPYVFAIYKELIRWHPILPGGIPHRSTAEDEYKGMRIPSDCIVMPNVWAMVRDKSVYGPDADLFRPDRFLESDLRDPSVIIYGFGRRICPGRFMAENSLFIAIASICHLFNIGNPRDQNGAELKPETRWTSGLAVHLEPYTCTITPRFEGVGELLKSA